MVIAIGIGFALGKVKKLDKMPDWTTELLCAILAIAGLFAGFWFADAYKQYIIDQTQENQYERCVELLNSLSKIHQKWWIFWRVPPPASFDYTTKR